MVTQKVSLLSTLDHTITPGAVLGIMFGKHMVGLLRELVTDGSLGFCEKAKVWAALLLKVYIFLPLVHGDSHEDGQWILKQDFSH